MSLLRTVCYLGLLSVTVVACREEDSSGGVGSANTGGRGASTSSEGGTTSTSMMTVVGGSVGEGGMTGSVGGTAGMGGTSGTAGTGGSTAEPGYCTKACDTPADCCAPGTPGCPSDQYPNNHQCVNGACHPPECADTQDCATNPNLDCFALSGFNSCGFKCDVDADCAAPLTCTGSDDNGKTFCLFAGDGCTNDASCNGFGSCVDKLCVCTSDAECTAAGFTECAL